MIREEATTDNLPLGKERYYPNFIQRRFGNKIHFLTEVIGGKIIRRVFDLSDKTEIKEQREIFLKEAEQNAYNLTVEQVYKYDSAYDGTPYTIDNLPDGIDILDVMTEIRMGGIIQGDGFDDGIVTPEEAEVAINRAVERKRAMQNEKE